MRSDVTHQYRGQLGTLDGQTLTVALIGPGWTPSPDDTTLTSIAGDEIGAPGYARQTVSAAWDTVEGELTWDTVPAFDAAGADEILTVVTADSVGRIVTWHSWDAPIVGHDGMTIDLPVLARFVQVGGIRQIVPGENVSVDDSDEARPVVSATGGGGSGDIAELTSTGQPAGLIPVTDGVGAVTLEPVPTGGGGGGEVSMSWRSWPTGPHLPTVAVVGDMPTGDTPPTVPAGLARLVTPTVETPLTDDDGPVILGTIDPDHAPMDSQVMATATWVDMDTMATGPAVVVAQSTGEVMAMDLSGSLTDSDVVTLPLTTLQWLTLLGGH